MIRTARAATLEFREERLNLDVDAVQRTRCLF